MQNRYQPDSTLTTTDPLPESSAPKPPGAVARVNFAGLKKSAKGKTEYPVFPDSTGKAAETAALIIDLGAKFDAIEGALKSNKKFLAQLVRPHYFASLAQRVEIPSSIAVNCKDHNGLPAGVLVGFQNRYKLLSDDAATGVCYEQRLAKVLGDRVPEFFTQSFTIKIDGNLIPASAAAPLVEELQSLFARHNALDALSVTDGLQPVPDFHARRHSALTPEINLRLEETICPDGLMTVAIKTKGVK